MKNISIKQKNGTILFRMVKHEVGQKQKRKGGNTRLPTFGGCYCQQKARNGKEQILKRWRKMILCLDMVQIMNQKWKVLFFFLFLKKFFLLKILYWFCHTSTCICHRCTRVPNPEPPSHLLPHTIPLGHPNDPKV